MKSHINTITVEDGSPEWHKLREGRIGGSDLGTLMGLNQYKASIQLFYEKIGAYEPVRISSRPIFFGKYLEQQAADLWQYWDGEEQGYMENYDNGHKIRTCYDPKGITVNDKYPWLHASVDRIMEGGSMNFITGETMNYEAIVECKTVSQAALQKWEDEIPPTYVAQLTQYLMIHEVDYGEFALLISNYNGFDFKSISMEYSPVFGDQIKEQSHDFWYNRVVPGKEFQKKRSAFEAKGDIYGANEMLHEIQALEPPPDGTEAYGKFLSASAMYEPETIDANEEQIEQAKKLKMIKEMMKALEEKENLYKSQLKKFMLDNNADRLEIGDREYCSFKGRKGSDNLTFNNRIKKPDGYIVGIEIEKLKLLY